MTSIVSILLEVSVAVGLWWLYFVGYPRLVLDNTRQRLFRLRDELFEYAEAGIIAFDAPAYGMLRTTLNGMIQHAHGLSLSTWWALRYAEKRFGPDPGGARFARAFDAALKNLPADAQQQLRATLNAMHLTIIKHVIYRSPPLAMMLLAERALRRSHRAVLDAWVSRRERRRTMYVIDSQAQDIGAGRTPWACVTDRHPRMA